MTMKHLLLEVYCDCETTKGQEVPNFCINGTACQGIYCFENQCHFLSYTYCPNEIAYSSENGLIEIEENSIGFGGEMDADFDNIKYTEQRNQLLYHWERICKKKIVEAYDEYIKTKDDILKQLE